MKTFKQTTDEAIRIFFKEHTDKEIEKVTTVSRTTVKAITLYKTILNGEMK